ncbi:Mitochondrial cardiolipin hydrolase [Orchesella cincta]|uniref:Mitochondrial cardiolipin hydrolase n=1 Tax=Orchesella cincta TaxID=48709 RepID=A0A1D2NGL6_ORCCI|nr:Mitochondrial cardiolipin hydrolase [Orchesella cincta]
MNRLILTTIVTLFSSCTYYYIKKRKIAIVKKKPERVRIDAEDYWNTVIFFPDYFPEKPDSKIRQLLWYMDQATSTLDVCIFAIQFRLIHEKLVEMAKRGVIIRIITNYRCNIRRTKGITKRAKIHTFLSEFGCISDLMHHKFVIIDDFACIGGSLNWTWSAITENKENVVITTNPEIIRKFSLTFERLWTESGGLNELPWTCGG